jgi:hypothetical protein
MAHSGGVAPGYYLVPLQGTKNLPLGLTPRRRASDITDGRFRLCTLRMTTRPYSFLYSRVRSSQTISMCAPFFKPDAKIARPSNPAGLE